MVKTIKRRGRPLQDPGRAKDQAVLLRMEIKEKQGFREAADIAGITLSAWIRERLRTAAKQELEREGREVPFLKQK